MIASSVPPTSYLPSSSFPTLPRPYSPARTRSYCCEMQPTFMRDSSLLMPWSPVKGSIFQYCHNGDQICVCVWGEEHPNQSIATIHGTLLSRSTQDKHNPSASRSFCMENSIFTSLSSASASSFLCWAKLLVLFELFSLVAFLGVCANLLESFLVNISQN